MATKLFLKDAVADTHLGTDNLNLLSAAVGWTSKALSTTQGASVVASDSVATVTGATAGITITKTSPVEWISPPVSADVTISGTITGNVWASENNMSANVSICMVVEVIRANATATRNSNTIEEIGRRAPGTEIAVTTRAVNNFTMTPTSTVVNRGDRLRVRLFGDDVTGAVNMATGFTFNASWDGGAAADGDTYVTFTEDFSFEGSTAVSNLSVSSSAVIQGASGTTEAGAQSFTTTGAGTLTTVSAILRKQVTPVDTLVIELQSDSGSDTPSGSVVGAIATVAPGTLPAAPSAYQTFTYSVSISLAASTKYWIVARRSGARDTTNYYQWSGGGTDTISGGNSISSSGSWSSGANDQGFGYTITGISPAGSVLYLTNTASDVATASVDREAWTSRGAGVQTDVTNTAAGWTAPIQVTDTAGGTVVDWFSKQLQAFTLTGMAVANIRALESNAAANASLRCQVARVNSDGTSATVWADWAIAPTSTDNGELTTSEVARTANVSGDDLAFTDGQRIRVRLYAEDISSLAMATANTVTVYYAGTSAAASGDTYITLPQTVSEYVTATAGSAMQTMRQRRANRFLTNR